MKQRIRSLPARYVIVIAFLVTALLAGVMPFVSARAEEREVHDTDILPEDAADLVNMASKQAEGLSKIIYIMAPGDLAGQVSSARSSKAVERFHEVLERTEEGRNLLEKLSEAVTPKTTLADALIYNEGAPAKVGGDITGGIALVLVLTYAIIQLVIIMQRDQGSIEGWVRLGIQVVIGILAIVFCQEILEFLDKLGTYLWTALARAFHQISAGADVSVKESAEAASSSGFDIRQIFVSIKSWAAKMVFQIAMTIVYYSIICSVYGLVFEIVLRRVFMPLALADVTMEGAGSPGIRYLKAYFSCYVRMAMYAILISLSAIACDWALEDMLINGKNSSVMRIYDHFGYRGPEGYTSQIHTAFGAAGAMICIQGATRAAMGAATQIAREVFGI